MNNPSFPIDRDTVRPTSRQQRFCSIPCNLCHSRDIAVLSNRSRSGKPLRTVICRSCGLVWSDPRPYESKQFYEKDYRVVYKKTPVPKPKHILRAGKVALSRLEKIRPLISCPKSILDVGSGGGEFAYLLTSLGHHVNGIEPNRGYAEFSIQEYGLTVHIGFVQDCALPRESFDLITIWHVLEHTEDPGAVLSRLRSWLKPDGLMVVEVPNVEATCQSPKSKFHEAHLYNFNIVTLQGLGKQSRLQDVGHTVSSDGGNITMLFRRTDSSIGDFVGVNFLGNYERVSAILHKHTSLRHYLTLTPYRRVLQRFMKSYAEKRQLASFQNGKHLLNTLYRHARMVHEQ